MSGATHTFADVRQVALIGGGDLMLQTARDTRDAGLRTVIVLAPRHAAEPLPLAGKGTAETFAAEGFEVHQVENINAWPDFATQDWIGEDALGLCFGPSWIFRQHVLASFGAGMINFNGIPIPRYLGGAHYTWQILNGDRGGGCILQQITMDVDRGPILASHYFDLPSSVRVPQDYFVANHEEGCRFMKRAIADMRAGKPFEAVDFDSLNSDRLYFPRLYTAENAYIDWSWPGVAIERFCCAFDTPYPGAATFADGVEIRFSDVRLESDASMSFHPYVAGLVVRRTPGIAWIATRDGLLRVGQARRNDGSDAMPALGEGTRLGTPPDTLYHAQTFRPRLSAKGFQDGKDRKAG